MNNPTLPPFPPALTNDEYWAAQDPDIQPLRGKPPDAATIDALLKANKILDTQIHIWGWDAQITEYMRAAEGYTWVPSFGQPNIPVGPGISFPGLPSYDPGNPPSRSIKVSINPSDYPPTIIPHPPAPTPEPACPVGIREIGWGAANGVGDYYGRAYGDSLPVGSVWPVSGAGTTPQGYSGSWKLEDKAEMIGDVLIWVKIS